MNKNDKKFTQYEYNRKKNIMFILNTYNIEDFNKLCKKYNIVYNYYSVKNRIKIFEIKELIKYYNNLPKKISYDNLTHCGSNYKKGIIITLYKLSILSYNLSLTNNLKYLNKYIIKTKSRMYILYYINNTLIVSIRGSKYLNELKKGSFESDRIKYKFEKKETHNNFLDWKVDFVKDFEKNNTNNTNVSELKNKNIYVHKNYYYLSIKIKKELLAIIKKLNNKKCKLKNIILTGHSMGGSLSILVGMKLKEIYQDKYKIHISSFSNLGIGNRNLSLFALYLGIDSYIRIYNRLDIVDHYKSSIFYKLVGRLRHINHSFTKKYYSKYIKYDVEDNIPKKILNKINEREKLKKLYLRHKIYKFSNNKNSPIFI